jgi:hypothetical protein
VQHIQRAVTMQGGHSRMGQDGIHVRLDMPTPGNWGVWVYPTTGTTMDEANMSSRELLCCGCALQGGVGARRQHWTGFVPMWGHN